VLGLYGVGPADPLTFAVTAAALLTAALAASDGHQRRAAQSLGLLPTTLHEKMKRLGIPTAASARPLESE
jgi:transcriptional regulator with GAF, ATPase, and Fis domain